MKQVSSVLLRPSQEATVLRCDESPGKGLKDSWYGSVRLGDVGLCSSDWEIGYLVAMSASRTTEQLPSGR